ncbi:transporter, CPA2 family [Bacteriovorax sp. BSW11_IV]|uniref:potassium/proton antiporter n=1 Tax=Bacteriovorax sp. BSW11_IV TaxID=1353529 RepID=UPI00038A3C26|nr:potassium/proton antiporter [Bacteriovorax sp. BSW11_IV]EQC45017.1 transporter, CPA2 family [Bacteriovorax sp. BSW11_IV]
MEAILNQGLLIGSILLFVSVIISKSSSRFGLPILIIFMLVGMFAGGEGPGGIEFENYELTHSLSLVAIVLIIFSGALDTKFDEIKPVARRGVLLSTLGVILTAGLIGAFSYYIFKISLLKSLLLGAILSSTDAAAVFAAFKDRHSGFDRKLKGLLELESGSNDPMAYFLVTIFLGLVDKTITYETLWVDLVLNIIVGLLGGYAFSKLFLKINNSINLDFQGLYPALTMAFLFFTYAATTLLKGNGLLAVYLFGLIIANKKFVHKNALISFYDGIAWLSQIGLFILLGLLAIPSRLVSVWQEGIWLSIFLIAIARPLIVYLLMVGGKYSLAQKFFASWAGLKGATPIVFASFAATHLGREVYFIFDIVFFVVVFSAIVQGMTLKYFARKLNFLYPLSHDEHFPIDMETLERTKYGIREIRLKSGDDAIGKRIVDIKLINGTRVLFIKRGDFLIIPDGSQTFDEGDRVLVATNEKGQLAEVEEILRNGSFFIEEPGDFEPVH